MKAFLIIVCVLLAFVLFFSSSTVARELAATGGSGSQTGGTGNPNKPEVSCGKGIPGGKCLPNPKPKQCPPGSKNRYQRCSTPEDNIAHKQELVSDVGKGSATTGGTKDPNKPAKPCGKDPYSKCQPNTKPKQCPPGSKNPRCSSIPEP